MIATILLITDNLSRCEQITTYLEDISCQVTTIKNLEFKVETHPSRFDAVILNIDSVSHQYGEQIMNVRQNYRVPILLCIHDDVTEFNLHSQDIDFVCRWPSKIQDLEIFVLQIELKKEYYVLTPCKVLIKFINIHTPNYL